MNCQCPKLAKCLQFALKFAIFASLLVVCYIYFMEEAITKFQKKATTVTEKSKKVGYQSPAVVICPNPTFKPSISDLHGFKYPTRDLFNMRSPFSEKYKHLFTKTTVRSLLDAFSYADDLEFKTWGKTLNEGDNLMKFGDVIINYVLKRIRTTYDGVCHVIQPRNIENWNEQFGAITVQYKNTLSVFDAPKSFFIYFVERDEWQGKICFLNQPFVLNYANMYIVFFLFYIRHC